MKKRLLPALLAIAMVVALLPMSVAADVADETAGTPAELKVEASEAPENGRHKFTPAEDAQLELNPEEEVRVSIVLEKPSTIAAGYSTLNIAKNASAMSYRDGLRQEQESVQAKIEREVLDGQDLDVAWNLTLATNLISANVKREDIEAIKAVDGVKDVVVERRYSPDVISVGGEMEPNMAISGQMTGAQDVWEIGYTGTGTRVAIIDTGLDTNHQSFDVGAFNYSLSRQGFDRSKLLKESDIAAVFDELNIADDAGASASALYRDAKVPFGWSYIDHDADITHDNDSQGEHGSHVAGIAAANSYVDVDGDGEYEKAIEAVGMQGNAPDAQILVMKVFGNGGAPADSDCVAAIEDAILLGADSVNLSLGMPLPGFAVPPEADNPYVELLKTLEDSDTVVVYAAGNSGAWADESYMGDLYNDDVNFSMGGESGSYSQALTVASVENDGMISPTITAFGEKFGYTETSYSNAPLATLDESGEGTTLKYVMLKAAGTEDADAAAVAKALGSASDYILVTRRGGTSFPEKGNAGDANGFKAVIVANNTDGTISMDLSDYTGTIPVVSITQAAGDILWSKGTASADGTYVTGELTIRGKFDIIEYNAKNYTMSDFSSWGVTGALEMKPEISAPGGNIWSVNGMVEDGTGYELMSGTSMAAPQIAGISALVQEYIKDKGYNEGMTSRALTTAILMSTARPMTDSTGNYYSLLQQGAGIADVEAAVTTPAYITVDGRTDGKVKAEIGDDPEKTGEYTVDFTVHNLTGNELYYGFDTDVFTQAVGSDQNGFDYLLKSTAPVEATVEYFVDGEKLANSDADLDYDFDGNGNVDKNDAQMLLDSVVAGAPLADGDVDGDGDVDTHDVHTLLAMGQTYATVPANGTVTVTAVISGVELDEADYPAGGYVEAFISAEAKATPEGVKYPTLSFPVFGYYGNWTDPSMYEVGTADEWWENYSENQSSDELNPLVGDRVPYTVVPMLTGQGNDGLTNIILQGESSVLTSGASLGLDPGELSYRYTPIRNSGNGVVQITYKDENGKDVLAWRSEDMGPEYAVSYYESADMWVRPTITSSLYYSLYNLVDIDWAKALENIPVDAEEVTISVIKAPEYYAKYDYNWDDLTDGDPANGELGAGAYLSTDVVLDLVAPEIVGVEVKPDETTEDPTVSVTVKDNDIVFTVGLYSEDGNGDLAYEFSPSVYQDAIDGVVDGEEMITSNMDLGEPDVPQTVVFDGIYEHSEDELFYQLFAGLNNYWSTEKAPLSPDVYLLVVQDLSGNVATQRVFVDMDEINVADSVTIYLDGVEVTEEDQPLEMLAGSNLALTALADPVNLSDRGVKWSSEDETVATVDEDGVVHALKKGTTTIVATANAKDADGNDVTAEVTIDVFTIPVTATGILGDVNGNAKVFTWDFETGDLDYDKEDKDETIFPAALTRYEDNTILVVDEDGTAYKLPEDAGLEPLAVSEEGAYSAVPYDMTYSENSGFWWTYNGYLLNETDPLAPEMFGFNFGSSYGTIFAIANTDEPFEYDYNGQLLTGDSVIYRLTNQGVIQVTLLHSGYQSALSLSLNLGIPVAFEGNQGMPLSNMVVGEDGALYISIMRNNTNEVYRLAFLNEDNTVMTVQDLLDSENIGYEFTPMGNFGDGVWPALFTDVKSNAAAHVNASNTVHGVAEVVETAAVEAAAFSPEEIAVPAAETVTGSLNSVDTGETTTEKAASDVSVSRFNQTVTVPVYADSTNGQFELEYDTSVLTLESVSPASAVLTSVEETLPAEGDEAVTGSVKVGFASKSAYNGIVATAVFSYEEVGSTTITLNVTEDGTSNPNTSTDYDVTLRIYVPSEPSDPTPSTPSTPSTPTTPEEPYRFDDVPEGSWYEDAVYELYEKGIIEGVGGDMYDPNSNVDRASIAAIIYRLAGKPASEGGMDFDDVTSGDWYEDAVNWVSKTGYMKGYGDGTFGASDTITRQDMIVTLWRYAKENGYDVSTAGFVMPDFADLDQVSDYAKEAMSWAVKEVICNGVGGNRLAPKGYASRAEVAALLARMLKLAEENTK